MNSISANLNIMIKASEKASKILIRDFGEIEKLQVSKKGPNDFVTNSDLRVEKIIIDELQKAKPNYSIISEENGVQVNRDKKNTWILDPIDGTVNFLHGIPHFAISIALKSEDEIISGLIFVSHQSKQNEILDQFLTLMFHPLCPKLISFQTEYHQSFLL